MQEQLSPEEVIEKNIEEKGFEEALYASDVIDAGVELLGDVLQWNPLKARLRVQFKKDAEPSIGFFDDWVSVLEKRKKSLDKKEKKKQEEERIKEKMDDAVSSSFLDVGDEVEVGSRILNAIQAEGQLIFDRGSFFQYNRNKACWEGVARHLIKKQVFPFSGAPIAGYDKEGNFKEKGALKVSNSFASGVVKIIESDVDKSARAGEEDGFFDKTVDGILYNDVFLKANKDSVEEVEPGPELRQTFHVDVDFKDQDVKTPKFDAYLKSTFAGDVDVDKKINLLMEFAAASLAGVATRYERAVILYDNTRSSTGANGKSVFLKVLQDLFPKGTVGSYDPTELSDKNTRAALAGKRLNASAELPEDSGVISGKTLKAFITGDKLSGEFKYRDSFLFSPRAGQLFACNNFPAITDDSQAFWRRWLVVPFNNTFSGDDREVGLDETIIEEEGSAILARLGRALKRLVERGGYDIPGECDAALSLWRRESSPITQFLIECTRDYNEGGLIRAVLAEGVDEVDAWTSTADLYAEYKDWARSFGFYKVSKTKFSRRINSRSIPKKRVQGRMSFRVRLKKGSEMPHRQGMPGVEYIDSM